MRVLFLTLSFFIAAVFCPLHSQMTSTSGAPYTPQNLIETVFLGDGVEVLSIQYEGDESAVGFFDGAQNILGMASGVVMTTGSAANTDRNGSQFSDVNLMDEAPSNGDLEALLVNPILNIQDQVRYTIRFIPFSDTLRFNFAFGSEEYPEFVCQEFNDVFGFFISGPGINGPYSDNAENIALIPGTTFPVAINSINGGQSSPGGMISNCSPPNGSLAFSNLYNDNNGQNTAPVYDGYTNVFTAEAIVQPCQEYTIKLAIADAGDAAYDSGVFLEAKSFGSRDFDLSFTDLALDGTLGEDCRTANLVFRIANVSNFDRILPLEYLGTATPGVDYTQLPDSIFIPAGEDSVSFVVQAFEDGLAEGVETIDIVFQRNLCQTDTLQIRITDYFLEPPSLPDSLIVCPGDTIALDATLPVQFPEPQRFESSGTVTIGVQPGEYSSFINIQGARPSRLQEGIIKSVCIDSLTHQMISDLNIYLIGPDGQVLELTTGNGGDGGNSFGEDAYINTCFTPVATDPITGPGNAAPPSMVPFTGEWMPEGNWPDIYNGNYRTNGNWELRIVDDQNFGAGRLWKWSICLYPLYEIDYAWSPDTSLSCTDCPITSYLGEGETLYQVTATDSYGCQIEDSVRTVYRETPPMSVPTCGMVTDSSIQVNWEAVTGAFSYEIRLDSRDFINVGQDLTYTFNRLLPSTDYTFEVRAVFDPCPGPIRTLDCTTAPCIQPQLMATSTDLSCFEANDGSISTISATGGRSPYDYFVNGTQASSGDSSMLIAGVYELVIADTVGCADTVLLTVNQPEAISLEITNVQMVSCNGAADAILVADVAGGVGSYTYNWNGVVSDDTLRNTGPGTYVLGIADANGCTASTQITITEPDLLTGSVVNVTTQNCIGPPNGTITTNMLGGTPPYTYSWNDTGIGNEASPTGLAAGDYAATVTDANGCTFQLSATVGLEPDIQSSGVTTDILCNSAATGAINVQVAVGQSPFDFAWTGPNNPTGDGNLTGLVAGDYQLVITDARTCVDTLNFTLTQPDTILGNARITEINCTDPNSGAIDWFGFGGVQPFSFGWSNGATTEDLLNVPSGTYGVTVTDANGCEIEQNYAVQMRPPIMLETIIDSVSCFGETDGGVYGRVENALPPYSTNWVLQGSTDSVAGLSLSNVRAGNYVLVGIDGAGCPINASITIPEPAPLELSIEKENIRCAGEVNGLIELNASGGTAAYQYRLDNGDYQANSVFIGLGAGLHTASVRDNNGCLNEVANIEIIEPEPLELELGDDLVIIWGDSMQLIPDIHGGSGLIVSYQWIAFDSTLISCEDCATVYVKPSEQTTIRLRITDDYGCTQEDFLTLFINKDFPVEVPTGFTPNNDGTNDRLIVHGLPGIVVKNFQVFNRWGGLVYEAKEFPVNNASFGWDGIYKGELSSGTFIWQVTARLPDGTEENYHGRTTLIR